MTQSVDDDLSIAVYEANLGTYKYQHTRAETWAGQPQLGYGIANARRAFTHQQRAAPLQHELR